MRQEKKKQWRRTKNFFFPKFEVLQKHMYIINAYSSSSLRWLWKASIL